MEIDFVSILTHVFTSPNGVSHVLVQNIDSHPERNALRRGNHFPSSCCCAPGLIRKLTGGLYTFLPLGLRVLRKVEQIVREEMNRAGALEVLDARACNQPEIWQKSGRYETASGCAFQGPRSRQERMGARPDARRSHHHAGGRRDQFATASCQRIFTRSRRSSAMKSARASA